jgi:hypothetical protein
MFVVLSGDIIRRLIYLIYLTLFRAEREHNNMYNIDSANKATRFIWSFIKF